MWYSARKVGITQIDMEHENIDTLLRLALDNPEGDLLALKAIDGLSNHLLHEEYIIEEEEGRAFPPLHREAHKRFAKLLKELRLKVVKGELSGAEVALLMIDELEQHVLTYDLLLDPNYEGPDVV